MPHNLPKCKITVLKRMLNQDLVDEYLADPAGFGPCSRYYEGQEFILEEPYEAPDGLCHWACANIAEDIWLVVLGAQVPWMKHPGTTIAGCSDYFRPVIFKIERME